MRKASRHIPFPKPHVRSLRFEDIPMTEKHRVVNRYFVAFGAPATAGTYYADWVIYGIESYDEDRDGVITDVDQGAVFATGHVKWDGCSNWAFKCDTHMHHACSGEGLLAVGDILLKCWEKTKDVIPDTWAA